MKRTALSIVTSNATDQGRAGRDQIGSWLFILMLCLLPIERMVLPFNSKIADLALVLLTLYGLIRAWRTRQRLDFPLLVPMWLIMLSSLVATLVGFAHPRSIVAIVQEVYLFTWFIALTNVLTVSLASDRNRLMKVWSVIALAEATTTLMGMLRIGPRMFYTSFFYAEPHQERIISTAGLSRAVGTYINPNAAAAYLSISFFVLLATPWPTWLRSVFGMWLLAGILGTGSMGALSSTIGSLVVLLVVHSMVSNQQEATLWGTVIGVGAGMLAAMLFIPVVWPSFISRAGFATDSRLLALTVGRLPHSLTGRFTRIEEYWPIFKRHPWGTGPDTSASLGLSLHNDYLAFLFERGPVGALGWLWMVGATLLTPLKAARLHTNGGRWQVLALGAGFLASAVNSIAHEVSHFRQLWVLMVFLYAASHAITARPTIRSLRTAELKGRGNL